MEKMKRKGQGKERKAGKEKNPRKVLGDSKMGHLLHGE